MGTKRMGRRCKQRVRNDGVYHKLHEWDECYKKTFVTFVKFVPFVFKKMICKEVLSWQPQKNG